MWVAFRGDMTWPKSSATRFPVAGAEEGRRGKADGVAQERMVPAGRWSAVSMRGWNSPKRLGSN